MANYTVTDIQKAYIAFFGRPGEPAGVDYWLSVSSVKTLADMYANFSADAEYRAYYAPYIGAGGAITDAPGMLNEVYHNLFNRSIESAGLTYWAPLLANGSITISNIVIVLLNAAQNADLVSVNSKLDAATAFTAAARAADYTGYAGSADAVIAHAWLSGVHDATSESAAVATIPATVGQIVSGGGNGHQYDLTTGPDTVPGTTGDDLIVATNLTLTANDRIHGGLPTASDVFKYVTNVDASHAGFFMDGVERVEVTADQHSSVDFDFSGTTGIKTVASLNSTGNVAFNQLTEIPLVVEVQNVTQQGNVTVQIQNAAVAGSSDSIILDLINNYNTGVGVITIGSVADANSGIETVNIKTSVAASTVAQLNVDMTTLTVTGDKSLVITAPLNGTERNIDAHTMTGNLTLASTLTGSAKVTYTGSQGVDIVTFAGTTGDHTIDSGKGNDVITLGAGHDNVNLNDGDDTLNVVTETITVLDHIDGGAGHDEIVLTGAGRLETTETFFVTGIETYTMKSSGIDLWVTDKMVNTSTGTLTVNMGVGGNIVDLTEVGTGNTLNVAIKGSTGDDVVVVTDNVAAGFASLKLGTGTDTLRIIDGATLAVGDLANIEGVDVVELFSDKSAQVWSLDLTGYTDTLEIRVDPNVQAAGGAGKLYLIGAGDNVTVYTTSSVAVVNADGTAYTGLANVTTSLFFTEQSDTTLIGGKGDDLFTANSLDQVQVGDVADGKGHIKGDRMLANFAVNDISKSIETFFSHATIRDIEILQFNPTNAVLKDVSFSANTAESGQYGDYDFHTFITSSGNDSIRFHGASSTAYTASLGDGNDTVYDSIDYLHGVNHITFNGGTGNDNFVFEQDYAWDSSDRYAPGEGIDTVTLYDNPFTGDATIAAGQIATLVTDGALEIVHVFADDDIAVVVNNADLYDFSPTSAHEHVATFNLEASDDVYFNASQNSDPANIVDVTIDAHGYVLAVGGAGDDTITLLHGTARHGLEPESLVNLVSTQDGGGLLGLRGGDIIPLSATQHGETDVVYKTAQDGGLEGQNGGVGVQDDIYNFISGTDKIVFALATGDYNTAAETGFGAIGTQMDKGGAGINAVTNNSTIDLATVELALFDHTGLNDADLLNLSTMAGFVSAGTSLQNSSPAHNQLVIVVQSVNDTAFYWFTDENGDTDASPNELSLMGIVHDQLLHTADFIQA